MEPKILVIGRVQSTMDVLCEEWERFGRDVVATSDVDRVKEIMQNNSIDIVVIGVGLSKEEVDEMQEYVEILDPNVIIQSSPKTEKSNPFQFMTSINSIALRFKVKQAQSKEY